jgi:hypothetical protein
MSISYQKIILPTRPQTDTIVAIFLLKKFGKEKYPGIEKAKIEILNNLPENETSESFFEKGFFLIDVGEGKFDHHFKNTTASYLIAEDLKIIDDPSISKLLSYAERDDKYGLGTISSDPIDKAFGLSAIITNFNKILPQNPQQIVELILPIIHAHYKEENRRFKELPEEFEQKLKENKAEIFTGKQGKKKLKVVAIESDNPSIVGWLRSVEGQKADIVIQKTSSNHINILTRPLKKIDLRPLIALIRKEELVCRSQNINLPIFVLIKSGRIPQVPQWYYDQATNSIQNGGLNPQGTPPTVISFEKIKEFIKEGLNRPSPSPSPSNF